jgi:hypothetical protein
MLSMADLYHITPIQNLSKIISSQEIKSKNRLLRQSISHVNIAYEGIQDRRARTQVPLAMGGVLHDYVPFYFAPRSPMLFTINKGNVPNYQAGQTPILHLVSNAFDIEEIDCSYVFTDGHATMAYTEFYEDLDALPHEIDWEIMEDKYWRDTDEDGDRKRRRQAEFLVYDFLPWELINHIGVINLTIRTQVLELLQHSVHKPTVSVHRDWYY